MVKSNAMSLAPSLPPYADNMPYPDNMPTSVEEWADFTPKPPDDVVYNATLTSYGLTNASSHNQFDNPCFRFQIIINTVVIGLLCIVGLAGNSAAILSLRRDRNNRVAAFLLLALNVADNSVLVVSFLVLTIVFGLFPVIDDNLMKCMLPYLIKYVNPLGHFVQSCSLWITVLLAVNRYIAVCKPFHAVKWLTMNSARIQVAVVIVVSIILNIPRIFIIDIYSSNPADSVNGTFNGTIPSSSSCSAVQFRLSAFGLDRRVQMIYFNILYTSLVLILPLILLVGLNVSLILNLHASKRSMQRNSISYSGQQESDITVVMVVIVLEMVLCHTPDRIANVVRFAVYPDSASAACPLAISYVLQITNVLVIFSSATDFVVYYVFRRRFRAVLLDQLKTTAERCRSLCCCCACWRLNRRRRLTTGTDLILSDGVFEDDRSPTEINGAALDRKDTLPSGILSDVRDGRLIEMDAERETPLAESEMDGMFARYAATERIAADGFKPSVTVL